MSLYWDDCNCRVESIPPSRADFFETTGKTLQKVGSSEESLYAYVAGVLDELVEATPGNKKIVEANVFSKESKHWNSDELSKLRKIFPDGSGFTKKLRGSYLGLLICQYMIKSKLDWYCTKTTYNNSDIERAAYWTKED